MNPSWMKQAACVGGSRAWITDADRLPAAVLAGMAEMCRSCPVLVECESFVAEEGISGGFWAGADRSTADVWVDEPLPSNEHGGEAA